MKFKIYKMEFYTGIHVGNTLLEDSEMMLHADTLFSALCHQAVAIGGNALVEEFCSRVKKGQLIFSDALPYDKENYYVPKPLIMRNITRDAALNKLGDSEQKKQDKKLKFIPIDRIEQYINGSLDLSDINEKLSNIGITELRTQVNIADSEDPLPYHVGIYHFNENCGLYFIMGYEDPQAETLADELIANLEFDGIGGKRNSGLGRFTLHFAKITDDIQNRLLGEYDRYMSLSVCLPQNEELEESLEGSSATLLRRGGFISSQKYASEFRRKKDLYVFNSGSTFTKRFKGDVYDVSIDGTHPVYRYAKPMWLGVNI